MACLHVSLGLWWLYWLQNLILEADFSCFLHPVSGRPPMQTKTGLATQLKESNVG